jgi:hypothetical protein
VVVAVEQKKLLLSRKVAVVVDVSRGVPMHRTAMSANRRAPPSSTSVKMRGR